MIAHKGGGRVKGIAAAESLHDYLARLALIFAEDFGFFHPAGAGNITVEIVGMSRADVGDIQAGLSPGGRIGGMGVYHASYMRPGLVKLQVGGGVGRGTEVTLHHLARQIHNDHVRGLHFVVRHAAGFDYHQAALTVDGGDVAPGKYHQTMADEVQVGLTDFLL